MDNKSHEKLPKVISTFIGFDALVGILSSVTACVLVAVILHESGGWSSRNENWTEGYQNWHPLLMSLAFLILMSPAVLAFEMLPFRRHINKSIHGLLNILSLCAAICGFSIIIDSQNIGEFGHFHSVHSLSGLATLCIFSINAIMAIILYVFKIGGSLRSILKPIHKRLGIWTLICGYSTMVAGMQEYASFGISGDADMCAHAFPIMAYLGLGGIIFNVCKFIDKNDPTEKPLLGEHYIVND